MKGRTCKLVRVAGLIFATLMVTLSAIPALAGAGGGGGGQRVASVSWMSPTFMAIAQAGLVAYVLLRRRRTAHYHK